MKTYHIIFKLLFLLLFLSSAKIYSQNDVKVGADSRGYSRQGGFYDYSEEDEVNINISVWGFVKFPGKYLVPSYVELIDVISYAGGPTDDAHLDDIRLFRKTESGSSKLHQYNYDDLMWKDKNETDIEITYEPVKIKAGDVVVVTGSQRLYFRDYLTITLSVFSALISLAILILNISKS